MTVSSRKPSQVVQDIVLILTRRGHVCLASSPVILGPDTLLPGAQNTVGVHRIFDPLIQVH